MSLKIKIDIFPLLCSAIHPSTLFWCGLLNFAVEIRLHLSYGARSANKILKKKTNPQQQCLYPKKS